MKSHRFHASRHLAGRVLAALLMLVCLLPLVSRAAEPVAVVLAPKWTHADYPGLDEIEAAVVARTNVERKKAKLPEVRPNPALVVAARQHDREMAEKNYFTHDSPVAEWKKPWQRAYYAGYWGEMVGENILKSPNPKQQTPRELADHFVALWMGSAGHKANILNKDWTLIGVGVVKVADTYYVTQLFAAPLVTLERAEVRPAAGKLATLTISGRADKTVNIWVNNLHRQEVAVQKKAFTTQLSYPTGSGSYEIMCGVGTVVAWIARLDTHADKPEKMLTVTKIINPDVVGSARVTCVAFTGVRLTARAIVPACKDVLLLQDNSVSAALTPDGARRVTVDVILPRQTRYYSLGFAIDGVVENLLFVDAAAPPATAFRMRPQ